MLKARNQDILYKILSCVFAVIFIAVIVVNREVIDIIYLGVISMFILIYFIEIRRK